MAEKLFSRNWKSSTVVRKQRKYRFNAPLHLRNNMVHSHLSKDLKQKHNVRSLRVRVGDKVKIVRGQFKGKTVKVNKVDLKTMKVYLDSIETIKKDGNKSFYPIDASNLVITELNLDDKRRLSKESKSKPKTEKKVVKKTVKKETKTGGKK